MIIWKNLITWLQTDLLKPKPTCTYFREYLYGKQNSTYGKERVLPWNEFIHDSIEAVVQIAAGQMEVHQRFEQMDPAEARTVFNIAWFTIKSNNRLNIQN